MILTIKQLLSIGLPLSLGFVSQLAISFTDVALVARLGPASLAGMALGTGVLSMVMLMGIGIVVAVTPKIAYCFKKSDTEGVGSWFNQGIWLSIIIGVISILILFNTGPILRYLGYPEPISAIAQSYNSGSAIGTVFFYVYINIRGFMSAVGDPKPLTLIMLCAIFMNFIIGVFLIFGIGEFSGLGVFGAGIASTVTYILIIIAAVIILLRSSRFKTSGLDFSRLDFNRGKLLHLLKIGTPIGFRILTTEGLPSVIIFMVAIYGIEAVAVNTIGLEIESLFSIVALGFSSAATAISSWNRADENGAAQMRLRTAIGMLGLCYVLVTSLFIYIFFDFIVYAVFGIRDIQIINQLWSLLPLILLSFAFGTWRAMYGGFLIGLLDTTVPTIVVMISFWGVGLCGGYFIANILGVGFAGYWIGMIAANAIGAVFNYMRIGFLVARYSE